MTCPPTGGGQEAMTQQRGNAWHDRRSGPLIGVPSAVVAAADSPDINVLINHAHPDAGATTIERQAPFTLDHRLSDPPLT